MTLLIYIVLIVLFVFMCLTRMLLGASGIKTLKRVSYNDDYQLSQKRNLDIDTKVTLWEFCERFVKHNTTIYLYSEKLIKGENQYHTELDHLETVMDWQIAPDYPESEYFRVHPDVLPSKYTYSNVLAVINSFEEPIKERIDCVSLIIDVG